MLVFDTRACNIMERMREKCIICNKVFVFFLSYMFQTATKKTKLYKICTKCTYIITHNYILYSLSKTLYCMYILLHDTLTQLNQVYLRLKSENGLRVVLFPVRIWVLSNKREIRLDFD